MAQCNTTQHNADTMQHNATQAKSHHKKHRNTTHNKKAQKHSKKIWQTQYILLSLQKRQQYGARYLRKQGGYK